LLQNKYEKQIEGVFMTDFSDRGLPVVVCVDGFDETIAAVKWAAAYAAKLQVLLRLVHTVPARDWFGSAVLSDDGALESHLREQGRVCLERAADAAREVSPGLSVETTIEGVSISAYVSDVQAQLVVLGTRKSGYARDLVLGSNTIRMVDQAKCPVLVWREEAESTDAARPIVVGIDGSSQSDRAFAIASGIAHAFEKPLVAANFWGIAADIGIGMGAGYIDWEKVRSDEKRWLTSHVEDLQLANPDVELSILSKESSPSRGMRALSSKASIVAVGCRGRGALRGAVLGSVSQNLIHHADCSVLIVR
jgi:nucleotide-binding universal stress UspA family protein